MHKFELVKSEEIRTELENINSLSKSMLNAGYLLYFHCNGGHELRTIKWLKKKDGLSLLWYDSLLPKWMILVRNLLPSYAALIKIHKTQELGYLIDTLAPTSMVGIYFLKIEKEKWLINQLSNGVVKIYDIISKGEYFVYEMDEYAPIDIKIARRWKCSKHLYKGLQGLQRRGTTQRHR